MAASFVAASSMRLTNAALVTAMPFTVGCWVNPSTVDSTVRAVWSLADTGSSNNFWEVRLTAANLWSIVAQAGAAITAANITSPAPTAGQWAFLLARVIAANNRRLAVVAVNSSYNHTQGTTSRSPAGIDTLSIGREETSAPANYLDGLVSHFWYTNTDIQPGGAQLEVALLLQLARYGPLSVPHIKNALVEYLPFAQSVLGDKGDYLSNRGRKNWANTNGVTLA